jgi:polar amino acid transport system substrate-binding protein
VRRATGILLLVLAAGAYAEELRWGFATADGRPYVHVHAQQLQGGFIYELGMSASQRLGIEAHFVETPNNRIEDFMQRGRIHIICNANPQWMKEPQNFD